MPTMLTPDMICAHRRQMEHFYSYDGSYFPLTFPQRMNVLGEHLADHIQRWNTRRGWADRYLFPEFPDECAYFDMTKIRPRGTPLSVGNSKAFEAIKNAEGPVWFVRTLPEWGTLSVPNMRSGMSNTLLINLEAAPDLGLSDNVLSSDYLTAVREALMSPEFRMSLTNRHVKADRAIGLTLNNIGKDVLSQVLIRESFAIRATVPVSTVGPRSEKELEQMAYVGESTRMKRSKTKIKLAKASKRRNRK